MNSEIGVLLVCDDKFGEQFTTRLLEHTTNLTIIDVIEISKSQHGVDLSETDCIIGVDVRGEPPVETQYEYLRENNPECPIVIASDKDENIELMERIITDELSEYVFLPEEEIPFGLLSVRCKRLVSKRQVHN